jgi:hypothetical protein
MHLAACKQRGEGRVDAATVIASNRSNSCDRRPGGATRARWSCCVWAGPAARSCRLEYSNSTWARQAPRNSPNGSIATQPRALPGNRDEGPLHAYRGTERDGGELSARGTQGVFRRIRSVQLLVPAQALDRVREAAGYETLRLHDLRRSFVSNQLSAGTPIHVVRDLAAHRSLSVTALRHSTDEARRAASQRVQIAVSTTSRDTKLNPRIRNRVKPLVPRDGIEPPTRGFSKVFERITSGGKRKVSAG